MTGLGWLWRWSRAGRGPDAQARLGALQRLGSYSLERTRALAQRFEADLETSRGTLVLLRRPGALAVQHVVRSFDPCMVCTVH